DSSAGNSAHPFVVRFLLLRPARALLGVQTIAQGYELLPLARALAARGLGEAAGHLVCRLRLEKKKGGRAAPPRSAHLRSCAAPPPSPAPCPGGAVPRTQAPPLPALPPRPRPQGPGRAGPTPGAARAASRVGQCRTPRSAERPLSPPASPGLWAGAQRRQLGA